MPSAAATPQLLCRFESGPVTLPAATPVTVDVPINGARSWLCVVKNTGATNAVTALTVAASPLGSLFEAPASVTTGLPLAAGDALPGIRGDGEPVTTLRLVLTSTSGTTVSIEAGGW